MILDGRKESEPPAPGSDEIPFALACPRCRTPLQALAPDERCCPSDGTAYRLEHGIWQFLQPDRSTYFQQFLEEYETVRRDEGRGSNDPAYFRALPFEDRTGRFDGEWRIRAKSLAMLIHRILSPIEARRGEPLKILDLGAGNGWLSYRLAERGHRVAAVDLQTSNTDGLGAHAYYGVAFTPVQAEFDHLPFEDGQADLAVFNASLHYSVSYETTLKEALRVLRPDGQVAILDSPVYRNGRSGERMVREREARFGAQYGFRSITIPIESYLTYDRLHSVADALGIRWTLSEPFYGWRWMLRPWKARLLGRREPAIFLVIAGKRNRPGGRDQE